MFYLLRAEIGRKINFIMPCIKDHREYRPQFYSPSVRCSPRKTKNSLSSQLLLKSGGIVIIFFERELLYWYHLLYQKLRDENILKIVK